MSQRTKLLEDVILEIIEAAETKRVDSDERAPRKREL